MMLGQRQGVEMGIKNYLTSGEALVLNNVDQAHQNIQAGSALRYALMGSVGFKDGERLYVDTTNGSDNNTGESLDQAFATIQAAANKARYVPGTTSIATSRDRRRYVFVMPGQYNEQVLFSGYNISIIGIGHRSNGDYGVVINYDDAIVSTAVVGCSGSGLEFINLCIQCSQAIPALFLSSVSDAIVVRDCWIKGDNSKTCTIGISCAIKNSIIEDNIINGCITGIDVAAGAWFNNSIVRRNKITNCTNLIAIAATAVCTESEISNNSGVGSSTGIVNGQATDILIYGNHTKPALSDAGSTAGDNTTLA